MSTSSAPSCPTSLHDIELVAAAASAAASAAIALPAAAPGTAVALKVLHLLEQLHVVLSHLRATLLLGGQLCPQLLALLLKLQHLAPEPVSLSSQDVNQRQRVGLPVTQRAHSSAAGATLQVATRIRCAVGGRLRFIRRRQWRTERMRQVESGAGARPRSVGGLLRSTGARYLLFQLGF